MHYALCNIADLACMLMHHSKLLRLCCVEIMHLLWHILWIMVLLKPSLSVITSTKEPFEIIGMFTISSTEQESIAIKEAYGVYPREAARLAVEHMREEELLAEHNYELQMLEFDTSCDQIGAIKANLEFTRNKGFDSAPDLPYALLGPVCSVSTALVASITSQYIKAVQVSYGVLSPEFSDVETYSYFYRTVPEFTAYVEPITAIFEYFDWKVIGIVVADNVRYGLLTESLANYLAMRNTDFRILITLSIASHFRLEGRGLRDLVRIYLALVDETMGADTLCAAYRSGLTGGDFVWILLGDYYDGWWMNLKELECTEEEMLEAIESTIIISNTRRISNQNFSSITGQNESAFWDDFSKHLKLNTGLDFDESRTPRVLQTYDAVWAIAKALNVTLTEGNFTSTVEDRTTVGVVNSARVERLHEALNKNMKKLSFIGASGEIKFSKEFNSPQDPATTIFQMQNRSLTPVGIYKDLILDFQSNLSWINGEPPRDRPIEILRVVDLWIIAIALVLTALVIVYAIVILIINIIFRKHKVIKASSPFINILIIAGCIIGLFIIPVLSVENLDVDHLLSEFGYIFFCNSRTWLVHISLTLAFGPLFVKTWRVYLIFRNPWAKARPYKDRVLLCIVGVMVAIDLVLLSLSTWRVHLTLNTYDFHFPEEFVEYYYRVCLTGETLYEPSTEFLVWLGVHAGIKALLFLFGIFLVIQTSKIKAKFFQDSRYIGICIFVTVFTVGIGVPTSFALLLNLQEDLSYVIAAATILFTSFFILTMVFVPRFILLRKYRGKVPTAVLLGLNPSFRSKRVLATKPQSRKKKLSTNNVENRSSAMALLRSSVVNRNSSDVQNSSSESSEDTREWEPAYDEEPSPPATVAPEDESTLENHYVSFEQSNCSISDCQTPSRDADGNNSILLISSVSVQVHSDN